jgi:ferric iron reductase protein FhuF
MIFVLDYIMENEPNKDVKDRFAEDYETLCELSPEVFNLKKNPFIHKPKYISNPYEEPEKPMLIRSSCCMYYKKENGTLCYNCPRMTPQERENKRLEIMEQRTASS